MEIKGIKKIFGASAFACFILVAAAVWLGGLNQDEGWYLYAANLVSEGRMPYRDFFYTQGPLLPIAYSPFRFVWDCAGLLGARIFTALIGVAGIFVVSCFAGDLVERGKAPVARLTVFILLACNLYHIYYVSIPKTYALAALSLSLGFWFFVKALKSDGAGNRYFMIAVSAAMFAFAAGARISLGLFLPVCALVLLFNFSDFRWSFLFFGLGGLLGLLAVYGAFLCDREAFEGLLAAQRYHAARGGFSPVLVVGSLSRLVRWYLPVFIVAGTAVLCGGVKAYFRDAGAAVRVSAIAALSGVFAVFALQMSAPCPYDDYQVPLAGMFAAVSTAVFLSAPPKGAFLEPRVSLLFVLGLSSAVSFGSPLLQEWMCDGQDRFWPVRKGKSELALLREAAREIDRLDPGGGSLLTQDVYLAVETGRRVPEGLEMGPFSILSDDEWRRLLLTTDIPLAALSGYTFAVDPPVCGERPLDEQLEFWNILKSRYSYAGKIDRFGQNATTLLFLKLAGGERAR